MTKAYNYKTSSNIVSVLWLSHNCGTAHKPVVTGSDKRKENPSSVSTHVTAPRGSCVFCHDAAHEDQVSCRSQQEKLESLTKRVKLFMKMKLALVCVSLIGLKIVKTLTMMQGVDSCRLLSEGKAIPLQAWTGPDGSRSLRLPDFKTIGTWRW